MLKLDVSSATWIKSGIVLVLIILFFPVCSLQLLVGILLFQHHILILEFVSVIHLLCRLLNGAVDENQIKVSAAVIKII